MDYKWVCITFMVIMLAMCVGLGLQQHDRGECRIVAIKSSIDPVLIKDICK